VCAFDRKSRSGFRRRRIEYSRAIVAAIGILLPAHIASGASGDFFARANELYGKGSFAEAAVFYRKSIAEGANSSLAYFNMGNCYYQLNAIPKAIGCYREAVDEAPGFFMAYLNLGVLYQLQEDWPATVATLEIADALEPDNKQVVLILAIAYRNLKAYAPAIKCIERALDLDSTLYDCSFLLFDIYQELDDFEEAVKCLDRYPDSEKRAAEKYRLLAGIADVKGEAEKAAYLYRKESELAPDNRVALYNLVGALNKSGHGLLALETAREALRRFGDAADLAVLAGNIAFERKCMREAGEFYKRAYSLNDARGLIGLRNVNKSGFPGFAGSTEYKEKASENHDTKDAKNK
jgi:predicted Zn-dependent protease